MSWVVAGYLFHWFSIWPPYITLIRINKCGYLFEQVFLNGLNELEGTLKSV